MDKERRPDLWSSAKHSGELVCKCERTFACVKHGLSGMLSDWGISFFSGLPRVPLQANTCDDCRSMQARLFGVSCMLVWVQSGQTSGRWLSVSDFSGMHSFSDVAALLAGAKFILLMNKSRVFDASHYVEWFYSHPTLLDNAMKQGVILHTCRQRDFEPTDTSKQSLHHAKIQNTVLPIFFYFTSLVLFWIISEDCCCNNPGRGATQIPHKFPVARAQASWLVTARECAADVSVKGAL